MENMGLYEDLSTARDVTEVIHLGAAASGPPMSPSVPLMLTKHILVLVSCDGVEPFLSGTWGVWCRWNVTVAPSTCSVTSLLRTGTGPSLRVGRVVFWEIPSMWV